MFFIDLMFVINKKSYLYSDFVSFFFLFRYKWYFVLFWLVSVWVSGICNEWLGYYIKDSDLSFEDKFIGKIWKDFCLSCSIFNVFLVCLFCVDKSDDFKLV